MQGLNKNAVGMTVGGFMAVVHFCWLVLVGLGWAKPLTDLVLSLHHISLTYSISTLTLGLAIGLLVYAFIVGYVFGWVFAALWNKFRRE